MRTEQVDYREQDKLGIITLNRPEKLNALTEEMVQGVADAIAAATASAAVAVIVLRGAGGTLTAGYDLSAAEEFSGPTEPESWQTPFGAPGPTPRPGNWDPVRDYQFMNNNVRRFMSLWECPKPIIAEIAGWAIGGATDLVMCADLSAAVEAEANRLATIPANQLALNKLLINQAYENMGLRTTQMLGTFFDGMARHTEEALRWTEDAAERGLREVVAERDGPWQDYGQETPP